MDCGWDMVDEFQSSNLFWCWNGEDGQCVLTVIYGLVLSTVQISAPCKIFEDPKCCFRAGNQSKKIA